MEHEGQTVRASGMRVSRVYLPALRYRRCQVSLKQGNQEGWWKAEGPDRYLGGMSSLECLVEQEGSSLEALYTENCHGLGSIYSNGKDFLNFILGLFAPSICSFSLGLIFEVLVNLLVPQTEVR